MVNLDRRHTFAEEKRLLKIWRKEKEAEKQKLKQKIKEEHKKIPKKIKQVQLREQCKKEKKKEVLKHALNPKCNWFAKEIKKTRKISIAHFDLLTYQIHSKTKFNILAEEKNVTMKLTRAVIMMQKSENRRRQNKSKTTALIKQKHEENKQKTRSHIG